MMELIQDDRRTIIMSSHILSDVEKVIDHVIIMKAVRPPPREAAQEEPGLAQPVAGLQP